MNTQFVCRHCGEQITNAFGKWYSPGIAKSGTPVCKEAPGEGIDKVHEPSGVCGVTYSTPDGVRSCGRPPGHRSFHYVDDIGTPEKQTFVIVVSADIDGEIFRWEGYADNVAGALVTAESVWQESQHAEDCLCYMCKITREPIE